MQNSDDFRILEVDTCESTQSLLSAHAIENAELHAIAISNEQTAGKGQRGNSWVSPKGKGWYFSIYLPHLQIPIFQVQLINWVVSLKLIQALNKIGIDVKAKWPNDIYTLKGKLAGVLIENQISNRQIKSVIIGIGINTEPVEVEGNRLGITSLFEELQLHELEVDRNTFIKRLASDIYQQLHLPLVNLSHWHQEIQKYSYGINRYFTFEKEDIQFDARIKRIDEQGLLVLETDQGEIKATSGSIKWIKHV